MKTLIALGIMLGINIFLFMGNYAIQDITGQNDALLNYDNSFVGKFDAGNYTLNEDVSGNLPSDAGSISPDTGNFFTDTWASMKNWFLDTTGAGYLLAIVNAVPNFLKKFIDPVLAFILGVFWHALTLFLIISFFRGND